MTGTRKTVVLNKCDLVGKIAQTGVGHFSVTERMRTVSEICEKRGIVLKRGRRK